MPSKKVYLHIGGSAGLVTITLAATTTLLHQPAFGRIADITKLVLCNRGAASTRLNLGDTDTGLVGGVWTQRMAGITVPPNGTLTLTEEDIPKVFDRFSSASNIHAQISAATTLEISMECRETDG